MEEDFEFVDDSRSQTSSSGSQSPRTAPRRTPSPTADFEVVEAERVRKLDENDILVQDDYFVADLAAAAAENRESSATEDSLSEDDFVPVRRSKRNKKSNKTKAKKGLQSLSDVKSKIPPKVKQNNIFIE